MLPLWLWCKEELLLLLLYCWILLAKALFKEVPVEERLASLLSELEGFVKCLSKLSIKKLECFNDSFIMAFPSYCWFSSSCHWASLAFSLSLTYLWVTRFHSLSSLNCLRCLQNLWIFLAAKSYYKVFLVFLLNSSKALSDWFSLCFVFVTCCISPSSLSSHCVAVITAKQLRSISRLVYCCISLL